MRLVLFSAALFFGCGRVCTRAEPLSGLDGGPSICVLNTDCPRPSSVLVCGQDQDRLRECIDCVDNHCVHYRPETCP